ncbi:MAG TPA: GGDEF domain-containing protein [Terriglobales bacterium]|nr:GGDEF domain-containing protein [Terriglobales bacterium]
MHSRIQQTAKGFLLPGGALLLATAVLMRSGWIPSSALDFYYAAAFGAGLLLAWRFHSTRFFFMLLTLLLAERALVFFSAGRPPLPTKAALVSISILLPLNFVALALSRERGFIPAALVPRVFLLFLESVFVALTCRPDHPFAKDVLGYALFDHRWFSWTKVPQLGLLAFLGALCALATRFFLYRKPIENASLWCLLTVYFALQGGGTSHISTAYLGTAALIIVVGVVETSYLMAYHDELTTLPGRRAFNELLAGLNDPYAIAVVDVDHFKQFNDTYGHDTGDQVLRMVASRLAAVTGGGKAFRCGGEEFAVVFPGLSAKDALEHLEALREIIQGSAFKVRSSADRRQAARESERRKATAKKKSVRRGKLRTLPMSGEVSVTVSIGVAEPGVKNRDADQVINAADQALYRAKEGGRNRVEMDKPADRRLRARGGIA